MVRYRHRLNANLVVGLRRLASVGGVANLRSLGLTRNQWDNFQKLRYFGLVRRCVHADGSRRRGWWRISDLGRRFLAGEIAVFPVAVTYRGDVERWEGTPMTVEAVIGQDERYRQAQDYADDAESVV